MSQSAGAHAPSPAAERIRMGRRAARLTQAELAEAVGRSPGAVGQWEIGMSIPDETVLRRLAKVLARANGRQPWWWYAGHEADPHMADSKVRRSQKAGLPPRRHPNGPRDSRYVTPPSMPAAGVKVAA